MHACLEHDMALARTLLADPGVNPNAASGDLWAPLQLLGVYDRVSAVRWWER